MSTHSDHLFLPKRSMRYLLMSFSPAVPSTTPEPKGSFVRSTVTSSYSEATDTVSSVESLSTAGCTDTDLPAGRRYFGQSDKPLIGTAHVYHAMWVMFTETRCRQDFLVL